MIREDLRTICADPAAIDKLLKDTDTLIHLAAISNDPSAELNPALTETLNVGVTETLARAARERGIKFLFSSSCSVYGEAEGLADETPGRTAHDLRDLENPRRADPGRVGDADMVACRAAQRHLVRILASHAVRPGGQHLQSLQHALQRDQSVRQRPALASVPPRRRLRQGVRPFRRAARSEWRCFNIAHENLRVVDVVEVFKRINTRLAVVGVNEANEDRRDYRVSTARMAASGFQPRMTLEIGAEEMIEAILTGLIPDPESIFYRNSKWLKELSSLELSQHRDLTDLMDIRPGACPSEMTDPSVETPARPLNPW